MSETIVRNKFGLPLDGLAVAADWQGRGYSCGLMTDPQGQEWLAFVHACNELVTVVEGRLEIIIEGERVVAEPGDEVFIPRDAMHSVRNIGLGTTRWLYGYD
jgi:ethanolamine utilization protein EutQ (cupin superfamily)